MFRPVNLGIDPRNPAFDDRYGSVEEDWDAYESANEYNPEDNFTYEQP